MHQDNSRAPRPLRAWQTAALQKFLSAPGKDFLAVATPGAGKTTLALTAAMLLLREKAVEQVVVVAPTDHLRRQWADAAASFGIPLDPSWSNSSKLAPGYLGVVVTYAQVASDPDRHEGGVRARRTFVILDEVHHAGDSMSWGEAVLKAYGPATRRLSLSGSPWRSDTNPIPFVSYVADPEGVKRSQADFTYGYGDALRDGVVRPVVFMAYSGDARWRGGDGKDVEVTLDAVLDRRTSNRAWRTALNPEGEWIEQVLGAADARLTQVRTVMPDAGGLVLASNQTHARKYAKRLEAVCGEKAVVVLSDEPGASERIEEYAAGTDRWMVAVRMVSEGVDVPRLAIGVYGTNSSTSLFFTQAVGRFVRARREGETATLFVPSVPTMLTLAADIERERDHALSSVSSGDDGLDDESLSRANRRESVPDLPEVEFEALAATGHLDRVIYQGAEFNPSVSARHEAENDLLSLPGVLSVEEVGSILRERSAGYSVDVPAQSSSGDEQLPLHRRVHLARKELAREVSSYAVSSGVSHAQIHTTLRSICGGPAVAEATLQELVERRRHLLRYGLEPPPPPVLPVQKEPDAWTLPFG